MNQRNHVNAIDLSGDVFKIESIFTSYIGTMGLVPTSNPLWQLYKPIELCLADGTKPTAATPIYKPKSFKGIGDWYFLLAGDNPGATLKKIKRAYEQIDITDPYLDVRGPFKTKQEAQSFEHYLLKEEFPNDCPISVDVSIRESGGEYFCHCTYERKI